MYKMYIVQVILISSLYSLYYGWEGGGGGGGGGKIGKSSICMEGTIVWFREEDVPIAGQIRLLWNLPACTYQASLAATIFCPVPGYFNFLDICENCTKSVETFITKVECRVKWGYRI